MPLILLHGWGGSSRYWYGALESLSDSRTVYALDLPGYGESPPWKNAASLENVAAVVLEFADKLGLTHFDLNGHSFATSIAVYITVKAPERVRRLVLTCASTYRSERERRFAQKVHKIVGLWVSLRRPWMGRTRMVYRAANRHFFYRIPADDELLRTSFDDFLRMDEQTALAHANDVTNGDYHATLRQVSVPTMVIAARQDAVMRTSGTPYLAQLIPNGRLTWIEQCGHLPMIERPELYHLLLRNFLLSDA